MIRVFSRFSGDCLPARGQLCHPPCFWCVRDVFVAAPLRGMVYLALVLVSSLSVLRVDLHEILLCLGAATVFYV